MTRELQSQPWNSLPTIAPPDRVPREGETIFSRVTSKSKADYRIDPETGCWLWLKFKTKRGYAGNHAHRLYWARANGPIPEGWHVHHLCRNPSCVNPDHLEAVPADHHWQEHHLLERLGLTIDDVKDICDLARDPDVRYRDIADSYGFKHLDAVYRIIRGVSWAEHTGGEVKVELPPCRQCGGPVVGRRNKRFCKPECRNAFNHRKAKVAA